MDLQNNLQNKIQDKEVIALFYEKLNRGQITAALNDIAEDAANHGVGVAGAGYKIVLEDIYNTFPDWRLWMRSRNAIRSSFARKLRRRISASANCPSTAGC